MRKIIFAGSIVAALSFTLLSCYNDNRQDLYPLPPPNSCDTTNITYTNTLKTIVGDHCAIAGCHAGPIPSGWDFSNYNGLRAVANNGKLMDAINHTGPFQMPKGMPKLDPCTILKFQAWVNNNMPE